MRFVDSMELASTEGIENDSLPMTRPLKYPFLAPLYTSKLNLLLLFIPPTLILRLTNAHPTLVFFSSMISLLPLASLLTFLTEQLSIQTNDTTAALLNISFGNITEIIISLLALKRRLFRIIQVSLLGSILSNMLLVLGSSFIIGGIRYKKQEFNRVISATNSGLLLLSVISILYPAVLHLADVERHGLDSLLALSRFSAVLLLISYAALIYFQMSTHSHLYANMEEDNDPVMISVGSAVLWLGALTVLISVLSEFVVGSIEAAALHMGTSMLFLASIVIPLVGNAIEHFAALSLARKNKMNLAVNVAIGSSTQIALFALPLCVVIAWVGDLELTMFFMPYETIVLFSSVVIVVNVVSDGESNWIKGLMLVFTYLIIAAGFFLHAE